MKIVIESHIPYIKGRLEPFAQVEYIDTAGITASAVRDADALLVRTRTRCDAALLDGSRVKFIGTATIGTDHIDLPYCASRGIEVANAPGCNAPAVAQWAHASIACWMQMRSLGHDASALTLGIVGVGHVGSIVERWARQLGFNVLLCDPPRAKAEGGDGFVNIDDIAAASDVITFHTPLDQSTRHLCDAAFLRRASRCQLLMNAARGAIADNDALAAWHGDVAIDCWEHEPSISAALLAKAIVATPHIAGYSVEGKMRATAAMLAALNAKYGFAAAVPQAGTPATGATAVTQQAILASYNPLADTARLKATPSAFEQLRNHYALRHELA